MKHIKKGEEPGVFIEWKKKPGNIQRTWKSFRRESVKSYVLNSLLQEQGYICCYCCGSITEKSCHIEHLEPKMITVMLSGSVRVSVPQGNISKPCQHSERSFTSPTETLARTFRMTI